MADRIRITHGAAAYQAVGSALDELLSPSIHSGVEREGWTENPR